MFFDYFFLWLVYLALLVAIGLAFRREIKTLEDFFLASRRLSAPLLAFSLTASWIGATSILITTDEAYKNGLSSLWLVGIPAWLTVVIMALALTGPIRKWGGFPLLDLLESRYGTEVRSLANLIIFWYLILLSASQLVALGKFFHYFLQKSYFFSLILGLIAVLFYTSLGGLFSVVINNFVQSIFLFSGCLAGFLWLLVRANQSGAIPPQQIFSSPVFGLFSNFSHNGLAAISFTLAWLISPIAWQRVHAARSQAEAKRGLWLTAAIFSLIYPLISFIGILGRSIGLKAEGAPLMAGLISLDQAPNWLKGLLFITVVAAILSTFDTAINACALFFSREILARSLKTHSARVLPLSRLITVAIGGLSFLVATRFESILQTIGLASEIMAEGLFFPVVAMFFLRRQFKLAGLFSLSLGAVFSLFSFLGGAKIITWFIPTWPASLPFGLGLSGLGLILGLLIGKLRLKRLR